MTDLDRGAAEDAPMAVIERSIRVLAIAIAMAGAFIALALYWRPSPPRYQVVAMGDQVVRLNTRNGIMVACNVDECGLVIRESQGIGPNRGHALLPIAASPAERAPQPVPAPVAPAAPNGR